MFCSMLHREESSCQFKEKTEELWVQVVVTFQISGVCGEIQSLPKDIVSYEVLCRITWIHYLQVLMLSLTD